MLGAVIAATSKSLGEGITVARTLPQAARRTIGPFVFFDQLGPLEMEAGIGREVDVRPHPHIGLSTVTYMFSGEIIHRDSLGYEQPIRPMEVNWMTAGSGITHSERFEKARIKGDRLHLIQAWVGLPDGMEEVAPSFSNHAGADLPTWREGGVDGRLIAGRAFGLTAAAETLSPLFYAHLDMSTGSTAEIPGGYPERAVYVAAGSVEVDGQTFGAGHMLVADSDASRVRALEPSIVMMLGGEPLGPRLVWWNFVSSSRERLVAAAEDWRAGRMALPPADHGDVIPLPKDPMPSAPALS